MFFFHFLVTEEVSKRIGYTNALPSNKHGFLKLFSIRWTNPFFDTSSKINLFFRFYAIKYQKILSCFTCPRSFINLMRRLLKQIWARKYQELENRLWDHNLQLCMNWFGEENRIPKLSTSTSNSDENFFRIHLTCIYSQMHQRKPVVELKTSCPSDLLSSLCFLAAPIDLPKICFGSSFVAPLRHMTVQSLELLCTGPVSCK